MFMYVFRCNKLINIYRTFFKLQCMQIFTPLIISLKVTLITLMMRNDVGSFSIVKIQIPAVNNDSVMIIRTL